MPVTRSGRWASCVAPHFRTATPVTAFAAFAATTATAAAAVRLEPPPKLLRLHSRDHERRVATVKVVDRLDGAEDALDDAIRYSIDAMV